MARKVLVVDDSVVNRKLASVLLAREGWQSVEAEDGASAFVALQEHNDIEIVLLDISMPDLSGEDVCRRLRAEPRTAQLPIIAYTAHALIEEHDHFIAIGFDAILVKPINLASLQQAMIKVQAARPARAQP